MCIQIRLRYRNLCFDVLIDNKDIKRNTNMNTVGVECIGFYFVGDSENNTISKIAEIKTKFYLPVNIEHIIQNTRNCFKKILRTEIYVFYRLNRVII